MKPRTINSYGVRINHRVYDSEERDEPLNYENTTVPDREAGSDQTMIATVEALRE